MLMTQLLQPLFVVSTVKAKVRCTVIKTMICLSARARPFRLGVVFDGSEVSTTAGDAIADEQDLFPGGIVGFKLDYFQEAC